MTISAECTVCTDQLTNEDQISACPCGHTFHHNCLQQWLNQCRNQPVCPFCRAKAPRKGIIQQLYFNAPNTSICSQDSPSSALSKLRNQLSTLQTEVAEVRSAKSKAEESQRQISEKLKKAEQEKEKSLRKLESKLTMFNLAKLKCKTYEEENQGYRNRETALLTKVKKLENIERNIEMMDQIKNLESGHESASYVNRLFSANEIEQVKKFSDQVQRVYQEKCNEMRRSEREMLDLKKNNSRHKRMLDKYSNEIETLKIKLHNAEKSLALSREKAKLISRADANSTVYDRLVAESPLSDDVLAKARAEFLTPKMPEIGKKRKSGDDLGNSDKIQRMLDPRDTSGTLFEDSPFSDNTLFEDHFQSKNIETPKIMSKKKDSKKILSEFILSSDSESEESSPIIQSKKLRVPQINLSPTDENKKPRIVRVKVKPKNPNLVSGLSPKKRSSNLDVSKMVRESNLFNKDNRKRYPNGLGGSSKQTVSKKLPSKTRKPNIADFFKNTKLQ